MTNKIFSVPFKVNISLAFALVWLINGLFCKVLNLVPRHQLIVSHILGADHAAFFTKLIGFSEVLMAVWIVSKFQPRLCALVQVSVIALMNLIEFMLVPDLLLFGRFNSVVAAVFILLILVNEFYTGLPQNKRALNIN
jgi:hypothetical protein